MSDNPKVSAAHRQRAAIVYVRQSTLAQLERNRESTTRQYDLVAKAVALGWPRGAVRVIDEDQGISGSSAEGRSGFAELAAQVGLGQVGIGPPRAFRIATIRVVRPLAVDSGTRCRPRVGYGSPVLSEVAWYYSGTRCSGPHPCGRVPSSGR